MITPLDHTSTPQWQSVQPIRFIDNQLELLDQRKLPHLIQYISYTDVTEVAHAIKDMVVRGAPAIGITAAYGIVLAAKKLLDTSPNHVLTELTLKPGF